MKQLATCVALLGLMSLINRNHPRFENTEPYPPYALVCARVVERAASNAEAILPPRDPDRRLLCLFWCGLLDRSDENQVDAITAPVRFCETRDGQGAEWTALFHVVSEHKRNLRRRRSETE